MAPFVLCTYWWGRGNLSTKGIKYEKLAEKLEKKCESLKIKYDIQELPVMEKKKYQHAINYKPQFIKKMVQKHGSILYIDTDIDIYKYPSLFENEHNADLMLFNWNYDPRVTRVVDPYILETSGHIMFYKNSPQTLKLLDLWNKSLKRNINMADDRILAMVFNKSNALKWCKVDWLPVEYDFIPQYYKHLKIKPVLCHSGDLTSEEVAAPHRSRIPSSYNLGRLVRKRDIYISDTNRPHIQPLLKAFKQYGLKTFITKPIRNDLKVHGAWKNYHLKIRDVLSGNTNDINKNARALMSMRVNVL
tara:strand:+ start:3804 stop:4712 length:909 start_codon:yes stop_codon:yes gene_type:complete